MKSAVLRLLVLVVATLTMATACGVSTQAHPQALATVASPTVPPPTGPITSLRQIYLVRNDRLVPVVRAIADPVTADGLLAALLRGPTPREGQRGYRSAIPTNVSVNSLKVGSGTAVLDLAAGLSGIASQEQALALGQLVYTITADSGVDTVRFQVDGEAVKLPRADGSLTENQVSRADYRGLLAR